MAERPLSMLRGAIAALVILFVIVPRAEAGSRLNSAQRVVEHDLQEYVHCQWMQTGVYAHCRSAGLIVDLYSYAPRDFVGCIDLEAFVIPGARTSPRAAELNQKAAIRVLKYFLPSWPGVERWFAKVAAETDRAGEIQQVSSGDIEIKAQRFEPTGGLGPLLRVTFGEPAYLQPDEDAPEMGCR